MRATVAAPIFRNIATDIIDILKIKKRTNQIEKEYRYYDIKYVKVPNVIGLEIKEAQKELKNFTIEYSGTGNKIISVSPEIGSSIPINSTIKIMLGE